MRDVVVYYLRTQQLVKASNILVKHTRRIHMKHILGPCTPPAVVDGIKKEDDVVWMDLVGAGGAGGFTPKSGLGPVCLSIHPL